MLWSACALMDLEKNRRPAKLVGQTDRIAKRGSRGVAEARLSHGTINLVDRAIRSAKHLYDVV